MKVFKAICVSIYASFLTALAHGQVLYTNNFESAEIGKVPDDFLVLAGDFAVKEEDGNKFLELPGSPLDSYGVQFGPGGNPEVSVSARIKATTKSRRFPTFGVALNGVAGYRLQISPGKKLLELYRDQELKGSGSFEWKSGAWTNLRLQVHKDTAGGWRIEGKAWSEGSAEPPWIVSITDKEEAPTGRASVFASPFSGTPIQFDDLVVEKASSSAR